MKAGKNWTSVIMSFVVTLNVSAQGSILGMSTEPVNPTVDDTILVMISESFSYGDCALDTSDVSLSGSTYYAYGHHCLGMLTVICNTVDTFTLIPPHISGTYTFDMTLTSGSGPSPCTPGIVIDDNQTFELIISDVSGQTEINGVWFNLYPIPATTELKVEGPYQQVHITDLNGKMLLSSNEQGESIDITGIESGFYLCVIYFESQVRVLRFQKE